MQEKQVKEQQIEYAKKILKIQEQVKTSLAQVHVQYSCMLIYGTKVMHGDHLFSRLIFRVPVEF